MISGAGRARGAGSAASALRRLLGDRRLPVVVTAVLLIAMYQFGSYRYSFDGQVFPNLLINNSYLIVAAVGATFVILTGGIDLSTGSLVGFSTVLTGVLMTNHHLPLEVAAVLVLAVGAFGGFLMGCMIHYFRVQPFIATLAGLFLFRGLSQVLSGESIPIDAGSVERLAQFHIPLPGGTFLSLGAAIALAVVAIAAVVLHLTKFGRRVYAIGGNEQSAVLMGLPVAKTKIAVYAVSGFCSALAGLVLVLYKQSGDPLSSIGLELDAIAAVVIGGALLTGGVGYVVGSLLGVLVIGLIRTILSDEGTFSSWWIKIVTGLLLLVFILLQRAVGSGVKTR
ncbi:galactofuranose ABC transporter, permease protein YjfF [Catenulispora subtropica]|uniref:galactofuranose ABC transporter, permease protein YjfF n=1 Tax=Catenulispora subtropica TaxID=450798 RepID=UPI0031D365C6